MWHEEVDRNKKFTNIGLRYLDAKFIKFPKLKA